LTVTSMFFISPQPQKIAVKTTCILSIMVTFPKSRWVTVIL